MDFELLMINDKIEIALEPGESHLGKFKSECEVSFTKKTVLTSINMCAGVPQDLFEQVPAPHQR